GKDRERERVPRRQQLVLRDAAAVLDEDVRTVNDLVTRCFTATIVDDDQRAVAVHRDAFALAALDRLQIEVFDCAVLAGLVFRRLFETCSAADVERAHRQLGARFTDRLRSDNADCFADFDRTASREITSVTLDAAAATRLAGQHRTNTHALHTRTLNLGSQIFVDLLVGGHDDRTFNWVGDVFQRCATNDAVAQRLDLLATFHNRTG